MNELNDTNSTNSIFEKVEGEPAWTLSEELQWHLTNAVRNPIKLARERFGDKIGSDVEAEQKRQGPAEFVRVMKFFNAHYLGDDLPACMKTEFVEKEAEATRFVAALLGDG